MSSMKKIAAVGVFFIIITSVGWMIFSSVKTVEKKEALVAAINEVPQFVFFDTDSSAVHVGSSFTHRPLVIIYFNSECDYCHEEAQSISDSIDLFKGIELLFLSRESLNVIRAFSEEKGLGNHENVSFGQIDADVVSNILGITSAPQLFIYNKAGKLTKQFKGGTKIEAIIKYAHQP